MTKDQHPRHLEHSLIPARQAKVQKVVDAAIACASKSIDESEAFFKKVDEILADLGVSGQDMAAMSGYTDGNPSKAQPNPRLTRRFWADVDAAISQGNFDRSYRFEVFNYLISGKTPTNETPDI